MKDRAKIGILGGGQLARMLVLEGHRLGLQMHVLCGSADDPAAQVCSNVMLGSLERLDDLNAFFKNIDAVTFESEFVDTKKVAQSAFSDIHIFPNLSAIEAIQDRLSQKSLLDQYHIPTAAWMSVFTKEDLELAAHRFKRGFVLKKRRFGYDGYGTYVIKKLKSEHFDILDDTGTGFIAEEFIPFKKELATTIICSNSDHKFLPLVETKQVNSRCLWVKGPVKHRQITQLQKQIYKMTKALNYQGALAFEIFETSTGLLINELAPRVHNSAHYSLDALNMSQFELHLRGGLNWQLPELKPVRAFAMVNLLGEGNPKVRLSQASHGKIHWYGKLENKSGRKLGHITTTDKTPDSALKDALKWRKDFQL